MKSNNSANKFTIFSIGIIFIILVSQCTNSVESLRILSLVPTPAISHFKFFQPILQGLAEAGHDVTVYGFFPNKDAPSNYHDVDLSSPDDKKFEGFPLDDGFIPTRLKFKSLFEFYVLKTMYDELCETTYNLKPIQKLINSNEKYDVILVEYFTNNCLLGITWKLQAPVIGLSSCALPPWHHDTFGTPLIPSFMPTTFSAYSENMSFSERFLNFINNNGMKLLHRLFVQPATNRLLQQKFGTNIPSVEEIERNASLIFVNTHYSVFGVKPYLPSIVEIGGIHMKNEKPIESKMKEFLDNASEGVLLFSWGSIIQISTMPEEKLQALFKALGSIKQKVLLKWESSDVIANKPANVFVSKWFQQQDILCHPNVKAFFTHGGLMGSTEAIHCGTPVIVTPFYGDQYLNAAAFVQRGMGHLLPFNNFTFDAIRESIEFVLNPKTQEQAKKVSIAFRDRINTPVETAVWWVEHVGKTAGAPLLKSSAVTLNSFVYHSFDVIGVLVLGLFLWICISIFVIRKLCCSKREKSQNIKKQKLK